MEFFKYFSQYFQTHSHLYTNTIEIDFFDLEDKISLNENAINDFINSCYAKKITIKKENALSIHILAKKFIVPSLIEDTQNFISTHQKDLVIELLILNQVNQNDDEIISEDYEEMISKDLLNYINDDRLFSLQIPVLYRILQKFYQDDKINSEEQYNQNICNFLFKCLDHFGRPASVLFSIFPSKSFSYNFLTRLHDEYSKIFDFHFLYAEIVNSFYHKESNTLEQTFKLKAELEKIVSEIEKIKIQLDEVNSEKVRKIELQKEEIKKLKDEQVKSNSEIDKMKTQLDEMNSEKDRKLNYRKKK